MTNRLPAHLTDHSNDSMKLFQVWPQTPAEPVQTWKPKHSTDSVYLMDFSFTYYPARVAQGKFSGLFSFAEFASLISWSRHLHHNIHFVSPLIFKSLDISRGWLTLESGSSHYHLHHIPGLNITLLPHLSPHPSVTGQCGRFAGDCTLVHTGDGSRVSVTDKSPSRS